MFAPVAASASFPRLEEEILRFWKERQIYTKSLEQRRGAPSFVFYEGPPTANGMPHPGHCLTRSIKDLFPRYKTMRGYLCERKAGWDTHGLPVEVEVCKELGIHSKEEIENYGVEPFIIKCQQSVWRYMQEWERLTERLGFWVNLREAYVTYHQTYIESVWWSLKNLFDRGLLYQGHKIVWWWAQGGTALSSGEVGLGYREVADPSVYVKFPLVDQPNTSLLVWTTTPWTLPSNQFAAVHPDLEYSTVIDSETGERLIMATALVDTIAAKVKREFKLESTCTGSELVKSGYVPPYDCYYKPTSEQEWHVVAAEFVTIDSGSGIVHIAPAFGEVDYDVLIKQQAGFASADAPQLINCVGPDGKFTDEAPEFVRGRWVKDCDKDISRDLKTRGLLYHLDQYLHDYPFCWRAEQDPLIQYPRRSWFIRTTQFRDAMLVNNGHINWMPEHIKDGRFGNFLESNVDWSLSRERYWGTPLPIWVCEQTGKMEAFGSYAELMQKPGLTGMEVWEAAKKKQPELADDLKIHKPYIDAITYDSPFAPGARMKRVTEVIDCWYDSGAMPFAQWGYPHNNADKFQSQFPADFISEAIDQTRGWFYSLLSISTMMFDQGMTNDQAPMTNENTGAQKSSKSAIPFPHPYKNCIVLGLMLAEWWEHKADSKQVFLTESDAIETCGTGNTVKRIGKMSKQKRNYREPTQIFDSYGADALRWYFFANQPPWNSILYSDRAIKDSIPEFLLRLWNCYTFFVIYANIDGFDPRGAGGPPASEKDGMAGKMPAPRPVAERSELDRWIVSELNRTLIAVVERMDAYDNFEACKRINEFVDGLSNWYVRRSRERFWSSDKNSPDKLDAYWTLYECLTTTAKMVAPFVPFLAETLWQNLCVSGHHAPRDETPDASLQQSTIPPVSSGVESAAVREAGFITQSVMTTLESVHLADYPTGDMALVDEALSKQMHVLREIASLGRAARMDNKLKVRQPLACVYVILSEITHQAWLWEHDALLKEELNVKHIEYIRDADKYITYLVQPNFKRLGPRVGKLLPAVKAELGKAVGAKLLAEMSSTGKVVLTIGGEKVELDNEDIQVRLQAKPGWAAAQGAEVVVVLNTELTPELLAEGLAKDLVRLVQDRRKAMDLAYTDRIEIGLVTLSEELKGAIESNRDYVLGETLGTSLVFATVAGAEAMEVEVGDYAATLYVSKVKN